RPRPDARRGVAPARLPLARGRTARRGRPVVEGPVVEGPVVEGPLEAAGLVPPAGGVGVGGAALAAEGAPRGGEVVARGTRRRLGQERDDLRRVADADLRGAVDEGAGQAGMEPDPRQGAAAVRDADLPGAGGGPEGTDGAERPEGVAGRLQRGGRRRVQEGQAP